MEIFFKCVANLPSFIILLKKLKYVCYGDKCYYLRLGPKVGVFVRRPARSLKHLAAVAGSKIGIQTLAGVVGQYLFT